jgi:SNF2 family DNA or RNA helicase
MASGDWLYSTQHRQTCKILDSETLWGETFCRVWLVDEDTVARVPAGSLKPLDQLEPPNDATIAYVTAAARVADALNQDILLSPLESPVIPLPHQIQVVSRAISSDRVRYLLADEVGLGKTIEAGLILKELKLRGLVKRTLLIVPKGLVTQWLAEMHTHFGEEFRLLSPSDFPAYRQNAIEENQWRTHDQVVASIDSVKPVERHRGWSKEQLAEHNRNRFDDLVSAGWDLVIVDEAHRLGGSTEQVARYKLGRGLAEASPYLLLLSATPHQGKSDSFRRLVSLLDDQAFPDSSVITRERVRPYVIRTEKRHAIDAEGQPLFKPRYTRLAPVSWQEGHREQRLLYEAVTDYVREGYNQALLEKKTYVGLLMILMQRLVTSSTRAIRTTLERRLDALRAPEEQLSLFPTISDEVWAELDSEEQVDTLLKAQLAALKSERSEVELLLELARRTESAGSDAKAEALLDLIYQMQQDEGEPDLKVLVFTEFVPTQAMLREFLAARGFSVVILNGSMDLDERQRVQREFAEKARIMISTDAGGEGINLQFCHIVVNYDIPWNPMRLEQRIGRVDRIGQDHVVRAHNLTLEETIEFRVREVLEEKLAVILREYGVDKTEDVLDSIEANELFDKLYLEAILNTGSVEVRIEEVVQRVREQAEAMRDNVSLLGTSEELDPDSAQKLKTHPLPTWVERMTVNYLKSNGGQASHIGGVWDLVWPDGTKTPQVVFSLKDAEAFPQSRHVTLGDARIRKLVTVSSPFAPGQPVPILELSGLPQNVQGVWSLWQIVLRAPNWNRHSVMPLFLHDDGRILIPTAQAIWDKLLMEYPVQVGCLYGEEASEAFLRASVQAETTGRPGYDHLLHAHVERLRQDREKGESAFQARRQAIERVGLQSVRDHRLSQLAHEDREWREALDERALVTPELIPLLVIRVEGSEHDA